MKAISPELLHNSLKDLMSSYCCDMYLSLASKLVIRNVVVSCSEWYCITCRGTDQVISGFWTWLWSMQESTSVWPWHLWPRLPSPPPSLSMVHLGLQVSVNATNLNSGKYNFLSFLSYVFLLQGSPSLGVGRDCKESEFSWHYELWLSLPPALRNFWGKYWVVWCTVIQYFHW